MFINNISEDKELLYNLLINCDYCLGFSNNKIDFQNNRIITKISDFNDIDDFNNELDKLKNDFITYIKFIKEKGIQYDYIINAKEAIENNPKYFLDITKISLDEFKILKLYWILQYTKKYNDLLETYFKQ